MVRFGKSESIGDHLDDIKVDSMNIQKSPKIRYDHPAQHLVTPEDDTCIYMVRGDTSDELDTSRQITNLLSIAGGYICESFSTSDQAIQFLPQFLRCFPKLQTVVLILETIYGAKSKASDYGILLRENSDIVVLSIELCHLRGPHDCIHTSDRKPGHIKLIGKYRDWYRLILDEVKNVVKKNAPAKMRYVGRVMNAVNDAAVVTRKNCKPRPVCRATRNKRNALPTILTPDDSVNIPLLDVYDPKADGNQLPADSSWTNPSHQAVRRSFPADSDTCWTRLAPLAVRNHLLADSKLRKENSHLVWRKIPNTSQCLSYLMLIKTGVLH
ncbi:uncharacterized protein LOC110458968 [Mizuhopecten yessoensis]|uniref:Uncharacterized protein n=1 Tax=Mizuhopecten yessoensis TaxID=6573 RepID=A0A210R353_MIZYE|nr:uncharacterized protein LOC110458968 [Mizuhopecten yessoensis]OWF55510.1 hypothetical protein KP79_PYT23105 [Mizuhopecten yessoensis]